MLRREDAYPLTASLDRCGPSWRHSNVAIQSQAVATTGPTLLWGRDAFPGLSKTSAMSTKRSTAAALLCRRSKRFLRPGCCGGTRHYRCR